MKHYYLNGYIHICREAYICTHTHCRVWKLPILGEFIKFFKPSVQYHQHLVAKYSFQRRNQHKLLVSKDIFALEYWLLEVLPLPVLHSILTGHSHDFLFLLSGLLEEVASLQVFDQINNSVNYNDGDDDNSNNGDLSPFFCCLSSSRKIAKYIAFFLAWGI